MTGRVQVKEITGKARNDGHGVGSSKREIYEPGRRKSNNTKSY